MGMRSQVESAVRTFVQYLVAGMVAWLGTAFGVEFSPETIVGVESFLFGILMAVVVLGLNLLAKRFPWVNQAMSLGMSREGVNYEQKPPPQGQKLPSQDEPNPLP